MIAKLPLVPFVIINLTRLTAGVCGSLAAQEKPLGQGWLMTKDIFQLSRFVTLHLPL